MGDTTNGDQPPGVPAGSGPARTQPAELEPARSQPAKPGPARSALAALSAATGMTILGVSAGVSAHLVHYPMLGGQLLRYAVAAALLFGVAAACDLPPTGRLSAGEVVRLTALAATGLVGFNVCVLRALRQADPATVGSIIGCSPLVLALAGPLLAGGRPHPRRLTAAAVVVTGAAVTQGFGQASLTGLLYALGALTGEAAFSLLAVSLLPRLGPLRVSAYACTVAVPLLAIAGALTEGRGMLRTPSAAELGALAYLAVILTVGAFVLWYSALARLGADRAGLFTGVVPVAAAASQVVLGFGRPTAGELAGTLLIAAGVAAGLAMPSRARSPSAPAPPGPLPDAVRPAFRLVP